MPPRRVAILLYDDVEVLDACAPYEVFSVCGRRDGLDLFDVYTVAERGPVLARNRLSLNPHYALETAPAPDLLVVPGGPGSRREMHNRPLLEWIGATAAEAELTLSVCTGALLLARAGLLEGLEATTHHGAVPLLQEIAPRTRVHADRRVVDNGRVVLSAGIAAGIDMSLHVVARLAGPAVAAETARYMEYPWQPEARA